MTNCLPVSTPMVQRVSMLNRGEKFLLTIKLCTVIWWAVSSVWLAGLVLTYLLLFQSFPGLCLLPVRTTYRQSSTCSGISRGLVNWAFATLSPRTVDQWIIRMCCKGLLIQIGLGVRFYVFIPLESGKQKIHGRLHSDAHLEAPEMYICLVYAWYIHVI